MHCQVVMSHTKCKATTYMNNFSGSNILKLATSYVLGTQKRFELAYNICLVLNEIWVSKSLNAKGKLSQPNSTSPKLNSSQLKLEWLHYFSLTHPTPPQTGIIQFQHRSYKLCRQWFLEYNLILTKQKEIVTAQPQPQPNSTSTRVGVDTVISWTTHTTPPV